MHSLEPQRVYHKDAVKWFKQSFDLLNRRIAANIVVVSLFFVFLFFSTQAMLTGQEVLSPVLLLFVFLLFTAFVFYHVIASLVIISYYSDNSQTINVSEIISSFVPSQKTLLTLTFIAVSLGMFFWYLAIFVNPENNLLESSQNLLRFFENDELAIYYILKTGIVFLLFVLLAMLALRSFFCLPLILFHQLSYAEAQKLSHKGIVKNILVITNVLIFWALCVLAAMKLAPVFVVLLLPLFSCFIYVVYRHIYLGVGINEDARALQGGLVNSKV